MQNLEEKINNVHQLRIQYLDVLSKFKNVSAYDALKITDRYIRGDDIPNPDNPDLSEVTDEIKRLSEESRLKDASAELKPRFTAMAGIGASSKKGEDGISINKLKSVFGMTVDEAKEQLNKSSSKEENPPSFDNLHDAIADAKKRRGLSDVNEETEIEKPKFPIGSVTKEGDEKNTKIDTPPMEMVDPKKKSSASQDDQQEPQQTQELQPKIPERYEDRIKYMESQMHKQQGQQSSITPGTDNFDSKGFGESTGEY